MITHSKLESKKYLGHSFEFVKKIHVYNELYKCINCGIIVYKDSDMQNSLFGPDLHYSQKLIITCDEVIIKNIIE